MSERAVNREYRLTALPGYKGPIRFNYQGQPGVVINVEKLRGAFGPEHSSGVLQNFLNAFMTPYGGGKELVSGHGTQAAPWKITAPEGLAATGPAEIVFSMLPLEADR